MGKELPKSDVGTPVLCDKNPDSTNIKRPKWCKGTIKDRQNPCKYEILTDNSDCVITRSRRRIKAYLTKSGRMSKPPKHIIRQKIEQVSYCKICKTEGICIDST